MGTPFHAKKNSDGSKPVVTAGFTPGGHIASGYSYLQRSHSLVTSTRRNVPQGLESPSAGKQVGFFSSPSPSPSQNPTSWLQRSSSSTSLTECLASPRLARQDLETQTLTDLVAQLPLNPKLWTPSQVALYLTHVLGLTPKPVVQDVTNYVRNSRMGGKVFMRLSEKALESEGLNLKWRKLMIAAVKKLRRDCLQGRMWGYEGGIQTTRQDEDMIEETDATDEDFGPKQTQANAMGTLKRLRDKKAIKAMISTFENANQDNGLEEESSTSAGGKRHRSQGSLSSLHSSDDSENFFSPIYGKGFVKSLAESYTSLIDATAQSSRKDYTKEELEHWFGSLSDQEAEALAKEIREDEELQQNVSKKHHHASSHSYSSHSSVSGESEARTPPPVEQAGFDLMPLDPEIIESIMGRPSLSTSSSECTNIGLCVEPLHRDVLVDDETVEYEHMQSLAQLRSELIKAGKMNLYRGSTYEEEDMVALGLHVEDEDDIKYSTARKFHRPLSDEQEGGEMSAAHDSVRLRKSENSLPFVMDIFGGVDVQEKRKAPDHMRHMSALEACGLSPYKSVSPGMSRSPSQRRQGEGEKVAGAVETKGRDAKESKMATFGRKGGANSMQLKSMLQAGGLLKDASVMTSTSEDGKKAEDENEWGTTVSRKASRRSTLAKAATRERDNVAGRMADLFTPSLQGELNADNLKELEKDHLFVPMTRIESSEDGKSISRKKSMVLVERKKFEALARRMGVLESQLAQLEAASLPSLSNLDTMSDRGKSSRLLDEIFTVPIPRPPQDGASGEEGEPCATDPDSPTRAWFVPMLLGAIPSYVIGLSAGVGFVLISEVMGKSRR